MEDSDTHDAVQAVVFAYIDVFYHRQRCHAAHGHLAPLVYAHVRKTGAMLGPATYGPISRGGAATPCNHAGSSMGAPREQRRASGAVQQRAGDTPAATRGEEA